MRKEMPKTSVMDIDSDLIGYVDVQHCTVLVQSLNFLFHYLSLDLDPITRSRIRVQWIRIRSWPKTIQLFQFFETSNPRSHNLKTALKVFSNQKWDGQTVVSIDRSPFKVYTPNTVQSDSVHVQFPSSEGQKTWSSRFLISDGGETMSGKIFSSYALNYIGPLSPSLLCIKMLRCTVMPGVGNDKV